MDFNVPLSSDIGYNRPMEAAPSTGGAIASFLSSALRNMPETTAPSNDEQFAKTLKVYQDKMPELRSTDPTIRNKAIAKLTPEFLSNSPEFASEFNSWSNAMGVEIKPTYQENLQTAQEAQRIDFISKDPLGMQSYAYALQNFKTPDGAVDEVKVNQYVDNAQLRQASLKASVDQLDAEAKVAGVYWNKTVQDGTSLVAQDLGFFNDISVRVSRGETVELPPEITQQIGVDKVSLTNLNTTLMAIRPLLVKSVERSITKSLEGSVDAGLLAQGAPKEIVDQWMAPFDKTVESISAGAKDFGAINKTLQDAATNLVLEDFRKNEPEFFAKMALINSLPPTLIPTVGSQILGQMDNVAESTVSRVSILLQSNATVEDVEKLSANSSVATSKESLSANVAFAQTGQLEGSQIKNNMVAIFADHNKVNANAQFGWDTFNGVFVKNSAGIIEQAAADPVFGAKVTENLSADIKKTLDAANEDIAGFGFKVEVSNGSLVLAKRQPDGTWAKIKEGVQKGLTAAAFGGANFGPRDTPSMKALQNKWDSLEKFGPIGEEIKGAFTLTEDTSFKIEPTSTPANSALIKVGNVDIAVNSSMQPLVGTMEGTSKLTMAGADARLEEMLQGPFQRLQKDFGKPLVINDALAKSGTSREKETKNSRHFHGDAIDIDVSGMSDAERLKLVDAAIAAGFQGFGFGNGILHVDLGARRAWAYGNDTFGGVKITDLKEKVRGSTVGAPNLTATTQTAALDTPEVDDNESAPTMFERLDSAPATTQPADLMANPMDLATPEPQQEVTEQPRATSAAPAVSQEGQNLLASIGGQVDKTFTTQEEFQAATAAGELEAGDIVNVNNELYFIRKDGSAQKVGG